MNRQLNLVVLVFVHPFPSASFVATVNSLPHLYLFASRAKRDVAHLLNNSKYNLKTCEQVIKKCCTGMSTIIN